MTTKPSSPLPLNPFNDPTWLSEYFPAYEVVLNAESHADDLFKANPRGRGEKENLAYARLTGFLLIELFDKRKVLLVDPCTALALAIATPPRDGGSVHDLVFSLGKLYCNHFIRTCAFCSPPPPTSF